MRGARGTPGTVVPGPEGGGAGRGARHERERARARGGGGREPDHALGAAAVGAPRSVPPRSGKGGGGGSEVRAEGPGREGRAEEGAGAAAAAGREAAEVPPSGRDKGAARGRAEPPSDESALGARAAPRAGGGGAAEGSVPRWRPERRWGGGGRAAWRVFGALNGGLHFPQCFVPSLFNRGARGPRTGRAARGGGGGGRNTRGGSGVSAWVRVVLRFGGS